MEQNEFCSMGVELNQRLSLLRLSASFCSGSFIQIGVQAMKDLKWRTGVKVKNVTTRNINLAYIYTFTILYLRI